MDYLRDLRLWLRCLITGREERRLRRAYFRPSRRSDLDGPLMNYFNQVVTVRYVGRGGPDAERVGQRLFHVTTPGVTPKLVRPAHDFDFLD